MVLYKPKNLDVYVNSESGLLVPPDFDGLENTVSGTQKTFIQKRSGLNAILLAVASLLIAGCNTGRIQCDKYGNVIRRTECSIDKHGGISWWELTDQNYWIRQSRQPCKEKECESCGVYGPYDSLPSDPPLSDPDARDFGIKFGDGHPLLSF